MKLSSVATCLCLAFALAHAQDQEQVQAQPQPQPQPQPEAVGGVRQRPQGPPGPGIGGLLSGKQSFSFSFLFRSKNLFVWERFRRWLLSVSEPHSLTLSVGRWVGRWVGWLVGRSVAGSAGGSSCVGRWKLHFFLLRVA